MTEADFSGYVTKAGVKCSDGRTITPQAFAHMHGATVPLVWQHTHGNVENVLGHVKLEARDDGMYGYAYLNDTPGGLHAKKMVLHGDIRSMSIFANQLKEHAKQVLHGIIREVSLVLAGANPKAVIDFVQVQHSEDPNDFTTVEDEAVIRMMEGLEHSATEVVEHAEDAGGATIQEIYDAMLPEEKQVLHFMVGEALRQKQDGDAMAQADSSDNNLEHEEGNNSDMTGKRNVFEQQAGQAAGEDQHTLSHDAMKGILADAERRGSLKAAVEAYGLAHGITNLDVLFPDAKNPDGNTFQWIKRQTAWVSGVLNSLGRSPFSRVKTVWADITQDDARAKGYITGNYKKEEWFGLLRRTTSPTTVYKKQKLDRDDLLDIDVDIVPIMKAEMRVMLEEELASAIIFSDGRDVGDEDKIKDPGSAAEGAGIRAIVNENELFATPVYVNLTGTPNYEEIVETILRARQFYLGTGSPKLYATPSLIVEMLLTKDTLGRRLWNNKAELALALNVDEIVEVPRQIVERAGSDILGVIVNLSDYNVGTDKGGEVTLFDDFDIDYNQFKYLIETRLSGALTMIKSAMVIRTTTTTNVQVTAPAPTFNTSTFVVTIPSQTGVTYKNAETNATLSSGAQSALAAGAHLTVRAYPATGYFMSTPAEETTWTFSRPAA